MERSEFLDYSWLFNPWVVAIALHSILGTISYFAPLKLLTPMGLLHACGLGVIIWGTLGWSGYTIVMFYFLVGSGVTRIRMDQKQAEGIAEKRSGARGPENVWGSALIGTICALLTLIPAIDHIIPQSWLLVAYVASFSTKLADTCASEFGKAYGKRTFLITTLQPVPRGTEGAVSLEGTLAGILGSIAIALVGLGVGMINLQGGLFSVVAAFIATNIESVIGATLQAKFSWLTNEVVNMINTFIGAIAAITFAWIWHY